MPTNLPTGPYNSAVTGRATLNGQMVLSGTNSNPVVTYKTATATNPSWNQNTATLTFSFGNWTFSGTYDGKNFSGTVSDRKSSAGETDPWSATSEGSEEDTYKP
jgi:hypothetical protein